VHTSTAIKQQTIKKIFNIVYSDTHKTRRFSVQKHFYTMASLLKLLIIEILITRLSFKDVD